VGGVDVWLRMLVAYDLAQTQKAARVILSKIKPIDASRFDTPASKSV